MILSDRDILRLLKSGELVIKPLRDDTVRENGVDLRIGDEVCEFIPNNTPLVTWERHIPEDLKGRYYNCIKADYYVIKPHRRYLLTTEEYIKLPPHIMAFVNQRSTIARLGLFVPPCFHPDTIVIDADGVARPASEAKAVFDPITLTFSSKKVTWRYNGEMVAVYVDDVPEIVTPNPRYLTFDETRSPPLAETPAAELKPGDYVAVSRRSMYFFGDRDIVLYPHGGARVTIDDDLATWIRDAAKNKGISISQLSRSIGRSRSYIINLLNKRYGARFADLEKVLTILGIAMEEAVYHIYLTASKGRIPATYYTHKVSDVADIVGYYVGDGYALSQHRMPIITDADEERLHVLGTRINKLFSVGFNIIRDGNRYRLLVNSHILRDWLAEHFGEGVLPTQPKRRIPEKIMLANNTAVAKFIAGLFDAEGSSNNTEDVIVTTVSKLLAVQTKAMLQRLGVYSSVDVKPCKKCRHGIIYAVRVNGLSARKMLRSWIRRYTTKKLAPLPTKETLDLVPLSLRARKTLSQLTDSPMYRGKIQNYVRRGRMPITAVPMIVKELRERRPAGWEQAISDIMTAARFRWVKVKHVEKIPYDGPVVDWETPSHWHTATTMISHNTVVDAGFEGELTIELIGGEFPVVLRPGQRFLHVIFAELKTPTSKPYRGGYQGQRGVRLPRLPLE